MPNINYHFGKSGAFAFGFSFTLGAIMAVGLVWLLVSLLGAFATGFWGAL